MPLRFAFRSLFQRHLPAFLLFAALAAIFVPASAQVAGTWSEAFFAPDSPPIQALEEGPDGEFYVAGDFASLGPAPAHGLARWHEGAWQSVGLGSTGSGVPPSVDHLAVLPDGQVVASGRLHRENGSSLGQLARFDGTSWTPLSGGPNPNHPIHALASNAAGDLFASTCYLVPPGHPGQAYEVYRWTNGVWTQLPPVLWCATLSPGPDRSVYAHHFDQLLRWTPGAPGWESIPLPPFSPVRIAYAPSQGQLYVVGRQGFGANTIERLMRYDGTTWHVLEQPSTPRTIPFVREGRDGVVYSVVQQGNETTILRWVGDAPQSVGEPLVGTVNQIAVDASGSVTAGGSFTSLDGSVANLARWTGSAWERIVPRGQGLPTQQSAGNPIRLAAAVAAGTESVYVAGNFTSIGGVDARAVARWDGTTWHPVGGNALSGSVRAMAHRSDGTLVVAGSSLAAGSVSSNVMAWNGTAWSPLSPLHCRADETLGLSAPTALVVSPEGALVASGHCSVHEGTAHDVGFVARLGPEGWTLLGQMNREPNGWSTSVTAIAYDPEGNLYATGRFDRVGDVPAASIARWDGTAWAPLSTGLRLSWEPPMGYALAWHEGSLFVGGTFDEAGGLSVSHIARWDGSAWHAADGFNGLVFALEAGANGRLTAGGLFKFSATQLVEGIATWDGSAWQPLGGGLFHNTYNNSNRRANVLAAFGDRLLVGGLFDRAGPYAAHNMSVWTFSSGSSTEEPPVEEPPVEEPPAPRAWVYPNPASSQATVEVVLEETALVRVALYDLLGRRVLTVHDGPLSAAVRHLMPVPTAGLAGGTYLVRIDMPDGRSTRRLTIIR